MGGDLGGADDGAAHVMDAYCPHLGANLALGNEQAGLFTPDDQLADPVDHHQPRAHD